MTSFNKQNAGCVLGSDMVGQGLRAVLLLDQPCTYKPCKLENRLRLPPGIAIKTTKSYPSGKNRCRNGDVQRPVLELCQCIEVQATKNDNCSLRRNFLIYLF